MATVPPPSDQYNPGVVDQTKAYVTRNAPGVLAKLISLVMYGLFQFFRFLGDVVKDAFSK